MALKCLQVEGWNGGKAKSTQGTRRMGPRQWNLVGAGAWQTRERIAGSSLRVNVFLGYHSNADGKWLKIPADRCVKKGWKRNRTEEVPTLCKKQNRKGRPPRAS